MARQAFEKHGTHQWKVAKEGIYASAFFVVFKRHAWINKSAFLISRAGPLGSKPSLKSGFFQIPKVFRLVGLVEGVHLLIKMPIILRNPPAFQWNRVQLFLLDTSF